MNMDFSLLLEVWLVWVIVDIALVAFGAAATLLIINHKHNNQSIAASGISLALGVIAVQHTFRFSILRFF